MIRIPPFNVHDADTEAEVLAWTNAPVGTICFARDTKQWFVKNGSWDSYGDSSGSGGSSGPVDWADILNKPATFAPSAHQHAADDVTSGVIAVARLGTGTPSFANFLRGDGTWATPVGGSDPWTYIRLTSDFTTTSATAVDVTGMAFTPSSNTRYEFRAMLMLRTATATVNARAGLAWPTGMTDGVAMIEQSQTTTAVPICANGNVNAALLIAVGGLPNTTQSWPARIEGMVIAGASPSGTVRVQLASETAGTTVRVVAGSWIAHRTIA